MIYLDSSATAKYRNVDDIIVDTITTAMKDSWQNPSSLYAFNIKGKIDKCRANIANFIGANAEEIYFTSGASESNNFAIRGWCDQVSKEFVIITTPIEHKSILNLLNDELLINHTYMCELDCYGTVNLESLERLLESFNNKHILVSIHMANNEIGTIQPIEKISELVHKHNGVLHIDATQAFGKIPIDVNKLGVDMMSVSGHKISPVLRGIGFLYKRTDVNIKPLIYGQQERGIRGGTENTYGIIGLNKALEYCDIDNKHINDMRKKRDYFIWLLKKEFDCQLNGDYYYRLQNNINVTFPQNITGESLLYMLDISDIKVSTGSACNSKSIQPSHVLKAIGLTDEDAIKTIRFTLSEDASYEDINYVVNEIKKAISIIEN